MKKFSLSVATVLAMGAFAVAGGDIEPVVEPVVVEVADAWAGPYVGIQAGYSWGDAESNAYEEYYLEPLNVDGFIGGAYVGYNWLLDNNIVVGVEGEWNYVSADDEGVVIQPTGYSYYGGKIEQDWDAALRLNVGVVKGDYLPYVTAGAAWAKVNVKGYENGTEVTSDSRTLSGWTIGAGIAKKIDENIVARIQYRYTDYGDDSWIQDSYDTGTDEHLNYNTNALTVGVSYRF